MRAITNLPVLAFLHGNPGSIALDKAELDHYKRASCHLHAPLLRRTDRLEASEIFEALRPKVAS